MADARELGSRIGGAAELMNATTQAYGGYAVTLENVRETVSRLHDSWEEVQVDYHRKVQRSEEFWASEAAQFLPPEERRWELQAIEAWRTEAQSELRRSHWHAMELLRDAGVHHGRAITALLEQIVPEAHRGDDVAVQHGLIGDLPLAGAAVRAAKAERERIADLAPGADVAPADVEQALAELQEAGIVGDEVSDHQLRWILWSLHEPGVSAADLAEVAREEGVDESTFDILDDAITWTTPEGRSFVVVEDGDDARELSRVTELLGGGRPSQSEERREANSWTFDTAFGRGDVDLVLRTGGAVVTTPEGILMAAPGSETLGFMPNPVQIFAGGGGTQWGEMFVINESYDNPAEELEQVVTTPRVPSSSGASDLHELLEHERAHAEQWAREGYWPFIRQYLWYETTGRSGCKNPFEIEAGLEEGGYHCCDGSCGG